MKALILNGSPKKKMGTSWYISKALKIMLPGCEKEEIALRDKRNHAKIIERLGEIDALVLSVPLYVDGIPSHILSFLQEIEKICAEHEYTFKLYVISNGGFIEGKQSAVHLDMYRCWCERAQIEWGGGLGIGGGVMLFVLLFVILAQIMILLAGIISNIVSGVSIAGTLQSFIPTIATWLFLNSGFLFCTYRLSGAIRRGVIIKNQYTRVMLPSFVFLIISDIFMTLMALLNGKLIFSLYRRDSMKDPKNKI